MIRTKHLLNLTKSTRYYSSTNRLNSWHTRSKATIVSDEEDHPPYDDPEIANEILHRIHNEHIRKLVKPDLEKIQLDGPPPIGWQNRTNISIVTIIFSSIFGVIFAINIAKWYERNRQIKVEDNLEEEIIEV